MKFLEKIIGRVILQVQVYMEETGREDSLARFPYLAVLAERFAEGEISHAQNAEMRRVKNGETTWARNAEISHAQNEEMRCVQNVETSHVQNAEIQEKRYDALLQKLSSDGADAVLAAAVDLALAASLVTEFAAYLNYYTGNRATLQLAYELCGTFCPDYAEVKRNCQRLGCAFSVEKKTPLCYANIEAGQELLSYLSGESCADFGIGSDAEEEWFFCKDALHPMYVKEQLADTGAELLAGGKTILHICGRGGRRFLVKHIAKRMAADVLFVRADQICGAEEDRECRMRQILREAFLYSCIVCVQEGRRKAEQEETAADLFRAAHAFSEAGIPVILCTEGAEEFSGRCSLEETAKNVEVRGTETADAGTRSVVRTEGTGTSSVVKAEGAETSSAAKTAGAETSSAATVGAGTYHVVETACAGMRSAAKAEDAETSSAVKAAGAETSSAVKAEDAEASSAVKAANPRNAGDGRIVRMELTPLTRAERARVWQGFAEQYSLEIDIEQCSVHYKLHASGIARAVTEWMESSTGKESATDKEGGSGCTPDGRMAQISDICYRILCGGETRNLGTVIRPRAALTDLVVSEQMKQTLGEICCGAVQGYRLYEEWGLGPHYPYGRGVSVLLAGAPGTGKTMTAHVLAHEIGVPLYQVDLPHIMDKYIGETEKHLEQVFDFAAKTNMILFFDEADALFAKRGEVTEGKDRYANMEVSYLLQRMEQFDGVVVLATNFYHHIDKAFLRRIKYVLKYSEPDETMRKKLWENCLPSSLPQENIDTDYLAKQFALSGGVIKNVIQGACIAAMYEKRPLCMEHLLGAVRMEYEKLDRSITPELWGEYGYLME